MLDNLSALVALADNGTMRRAALQLHVTQSAVSKRIATLEWQIKQKLIEPRGRKVELTPIAYRLLEKTRPLLSELKDLFLEEKAEASGRIVVDVSVSVLISWGARALRQVLKQYPALEFQINTHHASTAVERVRSGESMIALAQGQSTIAPDLEFLPLFEQTMVIIPSGLKRIRLTRGTKLKVLAIEPHTEAWAFTQKGLKENAKDWGIQIEVENPVQSFSAIVEMAKVGFGHGLAPLGVARSLGIPKDKMIPFPKPGLAIPVSLIGRHSTLARPVVQQIYGALKKVPEV